MAVRPGQLAFMPPEMARRLFLQRTQPTAPTSQVQRRTYPTYGPGPRAGQPKPPYMDATQLAAAAAQARTPMRLPMPMEQAAMRAAQMPGAMQASPAARAAPTIGQRLGTAFRQPLTSPTGMGIMSAALTGLEQAGPQPVPTSTGQILARMGAAGLQAYGSAQEAEAAKKMAERKLGLEERRLGIERIRAMAALQPKPKITAAMAEAEAMGFVQGTPEYNDYLKRRAEKPGTQIFMGGDKQKELAYKAAMDTRKEMQKKVGQDRELASRLQTAIDLLGSGDVETGRITAAMMPIKQFARELGFLTDEQMRDLTDLEIIDSAAAFMTPRMRVTGAGASSDRDMDFFERATIRMANSTGANLVIATMQKQVMDYNNRRMNLFDKYVQEKGHDFGFGEYADEQQGSVYQRVGTDEDFTKMIEDGKIKPGDVFFNAFDGVNEFQIYDPDEMG